MTYADLQILIAGDEHRTLELKKTTGELRDGMHTACAFLNTDGGWLVFSVAPGSLKILGQQVTDNTRREIAQALCGLEPAVNVGVEYVDVPGTNGCQAICMRFNAYSFGDRPYTYDGRPYYKVESTTRVMPRDMFEQRLKMSRPDFYSWEKQTAGESNLCDIDEHRVRRAMRLGVEGGRLHSTALSEPIESILEKLHFLSGGKPNNGALALFGTRLDSRFDLRMARFRGTDKDEFVDNQRVRGNFFDLLDAGMAFLFKWLALSGKIVGLHREEKLEIPYEALREALINALCHRNYDQHNVSIGIAIYDDRVEIESPGLFPPQITPETIKHDHGSFPRNPVMADFLFKTTFLESWGSGARRIVNACKAQGLTEPDWEERTGYVVIRFKRHGREVLEHLGGTWAELGRLCPAEVQNLIQMCDGDYLSVAEMMRLVGVERRNTFRDHYLRPALQAGILEAKHQDSPKHPKQKYKLTEPAIKWKENNRVADKQ